MVARFTKDKYGWRCTDVWFWFSLKEVNVKNDAPTSIYVNVTIHPGFGFCRRPHHYI
jgi:hypothetical protein